MWAPDLLARSIKAGDGLRDGQTEVGGSRPEAVSRFIHVYAGYRSFTKQTLLGAEGRLQLQLPTPFCEGASGITILRIILQQLARIVECMRVPLRLYVFNCPRIIPVRSIALS